ncbi:hypothetical protein TNCV_121571 [Trichonephila clavipes]|nr:hypothetical protein TNCV_121571 [Trichonephila clavipes]
MARNVRVVVTTRDLRQALLLLNAIKTLTVKGSNVAGRNVQMARVRLVTNALHVAPFVQKMIGKDANDYYLASLTLQVLLED